MGGRKRSPLGSLGCTHRAGGSRAGDEHVAAGHALDVFQQQPQQRQVELDDFGLLVLQKGRGTEVRAQGFHKVKKKKLFSQNVYTPPVGITLPATSSGK